MAVNIVSHFDLRGLGRQPFGLASPRGMAGANAATESQCSTLPAQSLNEAANWRLPLSSRIYLPMPYGHAAWRRNSIPLLRKQNPTAHFCCYGLYAPHETLTIFAALGVSTISRRANLKRGSVQLAGRLAMDGERAIAQARRTP